MNLFASVIVAVLFIPLACLLTFIFFLAGRVMKGAFAALKPWKEWLADWRRFSATGRAWGLIYLQAFILGLLFFTLPGFCKMRAHTRQNEAKANLLAIFNDQVAFRARHGRYASTLEELKVALDPEFNPPRYIFLINPDANALKIISLQLAGFPPSSPVAAPGQGAFLAVAVGQIDGDDSLDVWTINEKRELANPVNDVNR